jgi:hypothetical protein
VDEERDKVAAMCDFIGKMCCVNNWNSFGCEWNYPVTYSQCCEIVGEQRA